MVSDDAAGFRLMAAITRSQPMADWVFQRELERLRGVTIGVDRTTGEDVVLPYDDRVEGVAIVGKTKTGKSSLLERLILKDLANGTPGLVIDPHGLLAQRVVTLAPSWAADQIVLLEPSVTRPFGLNLLACRTAVNDEDDPISWAADSVVATVKKLYGEQDEYLPRLEYYLDLAARTLIPSQGTLTDAPRLFRNQAFRKACLERVSDRDVREDWSLYESLRQTDQVTHIEAVINRLSRLLRPRIIQGIVGSHATTIPFDKVLNGNVMLIFSLPSERLTPERSNFIGAMVLCALADRVFARKVSDQEPPHFHLYLDEYQRFATSTTGELLTQGRKYGAGVTLAYQNLSQITDGMLRGAARGTGTLIVLRVSRPDADEVAGEFPITPKLQSTEILEVRDGKKPVKVPIATPIPHLLTIGHNDPMVTDAARRLFAKGDNDGEADIPADDPLLENLFIDVMHGRVPSLQERLLDILYEFSEGKSRYSSKWGRTRYWGNLADYEVVISPPGTQGELTSEYAHFMEWDKNAAKARTALESWLKVHLTHQEELCEGVTPKPWEPLSDLERLTHIINFLHYGSSRLVDALRNPVPPRSAEEAFRLADDELLIFVLEHAKIKCGSGEWIKQMTHPQMVRRMVMAKFRERMRYIVTICRALAKEPILVNSGQEEDNYRQHVINHPAQTEQDARNEFAARLVNPGARWMAHVKLPIGYHEVKLAPPIEGKPNRQQLEKVKTRSQERYGAKARPGLQAPSTEEPDVGPARDTATGASVRPRKPIGRRSPTRRTDT